MIDVNNTENAPEQSDESTDPNNPKTPKSPNGPNVKIIPMFLPDLQKIYDYLIERPYKEVAPLVASILITIQTQR